MEAGKSGSGPGKPRTILRINPSGRYAIGVHLDPAAQFLDLGDGPRLLRVAVLPTLAALIAAVVLGLVVAVIMWMTGY